MGTRRNNLDIFFYYTPPGRLLNSLFCDEMFKTSQISHKGMDKELYYCLAAPVFPNHTEDEQNVFFQCAEKSMRGDHNDYSKVSVFNMLYHYADEILLNYNSIPVCRFEKILNWRDMSLRLGQDLFTCSFFAHHDVQYRTTTMIFSWPAVIDTDNERLHKILQKGMAENHFHLNVSSRSFELNWLALMNHENIIYEVATQFKRSLNHDVLERTAYREEMSWQIRLKQAAMIRAQLFEYLMYGKDVTNDILFGLADPIFYRSNSQCLQHIYGYPLPENGCILDYALTKSLHEDNYDHNRALVGERYFLYHCFKRIYENSFSPLCCNLFYLYLLIKSQFRGEMIQRNRRYGFKNFYNYQKRKNCAIKSNKYYKDERISLAVKEVNSESAVKSFEMRISPENSMLEMCKNIDNITRIYYDKNNLSLIKKGNLNVIDPFFVLHFQKEPDKEIPALNEFLVKCRNQKVRRDNKYYAIKVAELLNRFPAYRKLIRGIDGCSNEIGCRPEVLAHEFRFLSNFTPDSPILPFDKGEPLIIKRTFHVGEDFIDLTDGLRAIDEAILFLGLKRGDRLGHAVALGIDCMDYYRKQGKRVAIKKQDLLDNVCWLLCRSTSLGIIVPPKLKEQLCRIYHEIVHEIYAEYPYAHHMETYYDAWHLRGDNPCLYRSGRYQEQSNFIDGYDRWGINIKDTKSFRYRESEILYYAYHFNPFARQKGEEPIDFFITDELIQLIEQMQDSMQRLVEKCGIGIETNPTSNYLISKIGRFDKHPLLRFYNMGLEWEISELRQSAQICVSINTDDNGIFDTKLENEYAVMASAMERAKLPNGDKKYMSAQVYQWLDQIRQMGIEQSFGD